MMCNSAIAEESGKVQSCHSLFTQIVPHNLGVEFFNNPYTEIFFVYFEM